MLLWIQSFHAGIGSGQRFREGIGQYALVERNYALFVQLRHQYGRSLAVVANGQALNPSRAHVKLKGKTGSVRVRRLPASFYDGIVGETECIALGVMVLNKLYNTPVAGSSNSAGKALPGAAPLDCHRGNESCKK